MFQWRADVAARELISPHPPGLLRGGPCVPLQALNTADERQGLTWWPSALCACHNPVPEALGFPRRRTPLSNQSSRLPGQGKQVILTGRLSLHACPSCLL